MARFRRILKWTGIVIGSLVGLFILLIVLVAIFAGDDNDSRANTPAERPTSAPQAARTPVTPGPTVTRRPTATPRPTPTPIRVTANALERQHEANEVSWESKYVNRYVLITGSISSITEAGNQYNVKLNTTSIWVTIVCKVSRSNRSSVLDLRAGETVRVYGRVTDDGIVDIVVRDCTIRPPQATARVRTPTPTAVPRPIREPTLTPTFGPTPTPTLTPTPTPIPLPTPTPVATGLSLDDALPAGSTLFGTDGTLIVVTGIVEDAWAIVQAENQFNDLPEPGNRFYMGTVAVTYVFGSDSLNVRESDYSLIGDKRVVYTPYGHSCGVIPDELKAELFPGGQTEGNICFQVEVDDGNFILIHKPSWSFEGERRFLRLK